jgi:adenosylcobinamide-phosphate synthase
MMRLSPEEAERSMGAVGVGLLAGAVADRVEQRPRLGNGPPPGTGDVDRAARLSLLVGAAANVLVAAARR